MDINFYSTMFLMLITLLIGRFFIKKFDILKKYDIPEPVIGGIFIALILTIFSSFSNTKVNFDPNVKIPLMLMFYSTIGLNADLKMLLSVEKKFFIFLFTTIVLLVSQNIIGISVAKAIGQDPLVGLLAGSISLTGGHGTAATWGEIFEHNPYNFELATTIGIACATFGLIAAGLMGGPIAHFLIKRYKVKTNEEHLNDEDLISFEKDNKKERAITVNSLIESLALIFACLFFGQMIAKFMKNFPFTLPSFVWCLFFGVFLRNILSYFKIYKVFTREIEVIGNVCLGLFLAFALMDIKLLDLINLAFPILIILLSQIIFMFFYSWFVTFQLCGRDYDAAVLVAGQCGFAIGSSYNAIANMQGITNHNGPSHTAFIIIPIIGAFLIDIFNSIIVKLFTMNL